MPVDHEIAAVLQLLAAADQPMHEMTPQQARAWFAAASGVRVESRRFDEMIHGFFDMGPASAAARDAVTLTCAMFGELLHPGKCARPPRKGRHDR